LPRTTAALTEYHFVALILAGIGPLLAVARRLRAPGSLVLFAAGLLAAFVPGLPAVHVDPKLVLTLFLPPLLYASAVRVSWHLLRVTLLPGVVLGVALVPATIGAVAVTMAAIAPALAPEFSWSGVLLLGIVASVFDTRLFHEAEGRPHVPRAIADTLERFAPE
jgi:CPA1 family monovalent cation:H+ antiporter